MSNGEEELAWLKHPQRKEIEALVEECLDHLMTKFSSVQIVGTCYDPETNDTGSYSIGRGDWYARFGLMQSQMIRMKAREQKDILGLLPEAKS